MKRAVAVLYPLAFLLLGGCGGGGGSSEGGASSETKLAKARVEIAWPERGKAVQGLSSALSAEIVLKGAKKDGGDYRFFVNRDTDPKAYTRTYTTAESVAIGTCELSVKFYPQPDGVGDSVGRAQAHVTVKEDGTLVKPTDNTPLGPISTVGSLAGLYLSSQVVTMGTPVELTWTAVGYPVQGQPTPILALTPGSGVLKLVSGSTFLKITNNMAEGLAPGDCQVTVSVDGKTSEPATITVVSRAEVKISPPNATVAPGGTVSFSATVTNAPDQSVTWHVNMYEGEITSDGKYTAPNRTGTFSVFAKSKYDQSKMGIAEVNVTSASTPNAWSKVTLPTNDFVYNRVDSLLYASVPSSVGKKGNSITTINPTTGAVGANVFVGSEPNRLAITDDGKYLYAAIDGSAELAQFDTAAKKVTSRAALRSGQAGLMTCTELKSVPGHSNLVIASGRPADGSYYGQAIAMYDFSTSPPSVHMSDGQPPSRPNGYIGIGESTPGSDAVTLYAIPDWSPSGASMQTYMIDAKAPAITYATTVSQPTANFRGPFIVAGDRMYGTNGAIVNCDTLQPEGTFSGITQYDARPFAVDSAQKLAYYITGGGVTAYDINTFVPVGSAPFPDSGIAVGGLVRFGTSGIAVRTGDQVLTAPGIAIDRSARQRRTR